jgi:gamma-glutamylputrescine oxidase
MLYENWLHNGSLDIKTKYYRPLNKNISAEYLVIGGGFAGLHAALTLINSGKKVVLLEKRICGGSSSGQSGGFLSPESEEDMSDLVKQYNKEDAKKVYEIPQKGVGLIVSTVKKYKFKCDFRKQDSLMVSIKKSHNNRVIEEAKAKKEYGLPYELLDGKKLKKIHPGKNYVIGMKYPGSYGINSFAYCQEMKELLAKKGVKIYEGSEVQKIDGNTAKTHLGSVKAKKIIVCIDKMKSEFEEELSRKCYHIQTYIAVSEPLNKKEMNSLFPKGELMCWDTTFEYIYYRPVFGNRLLVGGSSSRTAYGSKLDYSSSIIESFIKDLKRNFPVIKNIEFTHYWSGLIDATKDLIPIADYDKNNKSIQYLLGCVGLNWAAYCGDYLARKAMNPERTEDLSRFLKSDRKFFISDRLQRLIGKKISFAVSHLRKFTK